LSKKPLLFKSFTGLTVLEFDDIYDKEMTKKYHKHENKRLSKRKDSESNLLVQEDLSNWMLKTDFSCFWRITVSLYHLHSGWLFV
jgi:hypothetical protein